MSLYSGICGVRPSKSGRKNFILENKLSVTRLSMNNSNGEQKLIKSHSSSELSKKQKPKKKEEEPLPRYFELSKPRNRESEEDLYRNVTLRIRAESKSNPEKTSSESALNPSEQGENPKPRYKLTTAMRHTSTNYKPFKTMLTPSPFNQWSVPLVPFPKPKKGSKQSKAAKAAAEAKAKEKAEPIFPPVKRENWLVAYAGMETTELDFGTPVEDFPQSSGEGPYVCSAKKFGHRPTKSQNEVEFERIPEENEGKDGFTRTESFAERYLRELLEELIRDKQNGGYIRPIRATANVVTSIPVLGFDDAESIPDPQEDASAGGGYTQLETDVKQQTLAALQNKFETLCSELNNLPVTGDTMRTRNRRIDLERALAKVESGIILFSRKRVFVSNN